MPSAALHIKPMTTSGHGLGLDQFALAGPMALDDHLYVAQGWPAPAASRASQQIQKRLPGTKLGQFDWTGWMPWLTYMPHEVGLLQLSDNLLGGIREDDGDAVVPVLGYVIGPAVRTDQTGQNVSRLEGFTRIRRILCFYAELCDLSYGPTKTKGSEMVQTSPKGAHQTWEITPR